MSGVVEQVRELHANVAASTDNEHITLNTDTVGQLLDVVDSLTRQRDILKWAKEGLVDELAYVRWRLVCVERRAEEAEAYQEDAERTLGRAEELSAFRLHQLCKSESKRAAAAKALQCAEDLSAYRLSKWEEERERVTKAIRVLQGEDSE